MLDRAATSDPVVGRLAAAGLLRIRTALADRLDVADLAGLDALLDGGQTDVRRRSDLRVTGRRQLWIARRVTR